MPGITYLLLTLMTLMLLLLLIFDYFTTVMLVELNIDKRIK